MNTCKCNYCVEHRMKLREYTKSYIHNKITLQQEFEANCMMYEHIESELNVAVKKYNNNKPLNDRQRSVIAKAIWRN